MACVGIGQSDWAFRTFFEVTEESLKEEHADIVFEGLDTYAVVELVSYKIRLGASHPIESVVTVEWREDCRVGYVH
jgi:hypothetical protein